MLETIRITASEFQKAFGAMSDAALRHPVMITKQGRDHLVVLSAEEYARLMRRDRKVYSMGELPGEWLDALKHSQMDSRYDHLNALLEDGE
jgi:prevent-host-death family protein